MKLAAFFAAFVLVLSTASASFAEPLVISHRGASYWAPEESKPAYLLAARLGGDFWEMDIQRTKDGVPVAIHDLTPQRTTNVADVFPGREKDEIGQFTFAELKRLSAGHAFNTLNPDRARPSFENVRILSFEEILKLVNESGYQGGLYVESKSPEKYPGIEDQIIELLRRYKWLDGENKPLRKIIFQSFDKKSIMRFKEKAPIVERTLLMDDKKAYQWPGDLRFGVKNGCTLGPAKSMFSVPLAKQALFKANRPIHAWTIDKEEDLKLAGKLNLDGVFTNRTDLAVVIYKKAQPSDVSGLLTKLGF